MIKRAGQYFDNIKSIKKQGETYRIKDIRGNVFIAWITPNDCFFTGSNFDKEITVFSLKEALHIINCGI
jgi:hypothetical protein